MGFHRDLAYHGDFVLIFNNQVSPLNQSVNLFLWQAHSYGPDSVIQLLVNPGAPFPYRFFLIKDCRLLFVFHGDAFQGLIGSWYAFCQNHPDAVSHETDLLAENGFTFNDSMILEA